MVGVQGVALSETEREMLAHPSVGGVILFTRNFESIEQLTVLIEDIHCIKTPHLLVAVDHEGGRVQRFRQDFTSIPPMRMFGELYEFDKPRAKRMAETAGWVMALELRSVGVDFSFAPVLDLDYGVSKVIGNRAFHHEPDAVSFLAQAYMHGMKRAGMAATGKHYPGHGFVEADSHVACPVDSRALADIFQADILPFERLINNGLAGIMPAHVVYENIDAQAAGFSKFWLQEILRTRLGFQGLIFSDDLEMEGARTAGGYADGAQAAMEAGCDMVLVCNDPQAMTQVVEGLSVPVDPVASLRRSRMHGLHPVDRQVMLNDPRWKQAVTALRELSAV